MIVNIYSVLHLAQNWYDDETLKWDRHTEKNVYVTFTRLSLSESVILGMQPIKQTKLTLLCNYVWTIRKLWFLGIRRPVSFISSMQGAL